MVAADVDGDGKLDIIVANKGANNVGVSINTGNGIFSSQMAYSTGGGSEPTSVVAADINGDNKLDIIVANSGRSNVGVFLNMGNGTFTKQTTYSTGGRSEPTSVVAADVNGDNKLDIIVANYAGNNVGVSINTGNGTFSNQTTYNAGSFAVPISVVAADVNGDNKLDIIIANSWASNVAVFLNTGVGSFTQQTIYSTGEGSTPTSVMAADVSGDNRPDIIVANSDSNNVGVFLNTGHGTFHTQVTYDTGSESLPTAVIAADVNGDNKLDIIAANYDSGSVGVLLNWGNGNFSNQTAYSLASGSQPQSVVAADVNGDNKFDLIVANYGTGDVDILLNAGNGMFPNQAICLKTSASFLYSVSAADVNGDNKLDIIVANYGRDNIGVLLNTGQGTFNIQTIFSTGCGSDPHSVATADVNGDNILDIIVANTGTNNVGVFLNAGNGTFSNQTIYSTGLDSGPFSVVGADVNGDGKLDINVANNGTNTIGVFLNIGNGMFATINLYSTAYGSFPVSVTTVDINGDNKLDIIVANSGANNVGVLFNRGNGTFSRQTTFSTVYGSNPVSVLAFDINDDNKMDIIVANSGTNNVGVLLNAGNGTFSTQTTYSTGFGSSPRSVVSVDVNGDNKLDIIVANYGSNNVGVFVNRGNGLLTGQTIYSIASGSLPLTAVSADVDGDNKVDIIVANSGSNNVGVLFNSVNVIFSAQTIYTAPDNSLTRYVVTADVDGDNKLDIVYIIFGYNRVGVLFNEGYNTFSTPAVYSTGDISRTFSVTAVDVNGDNKLDIIVANTGTNNVGVFLNAGNGTFSNQTIYSTGSDSEPIAVVGADVDGDSKLDIIVVNSGTNNVGVFLNAGNGMFPTQTIYSTGSESEPVSVVAADVDGDNKVDIIVANYDTDNVGVLLNMGNGTFANQMIYSTGSHSEPFFVVGADVDDKVDIIVANSNANNVGVLLNRGDGTFYNQMTFYIDQSSYITGLAAGDVNGDSKIDIITANYNSGNVGIFYAC